MLHNDCILPASKKYPYLSHELALVNSKADLENLFRQIENDRKLCQAGIILHLEMHGDKEAGIQLASGENMDWISLGNYLRRINIATRNNLMVTMATCFGGYVMQTLSAMCEASMYFLLGSFRKEYDIDLLRSYTEFYNELFESLDIASAFRKMREKRPRESEAFWPISEVEMFYKVYGGYLVNKCSYDAVKERAKSSIREAEERQGKILSRSERKLMEKRFMEVEKSNREKNYRIAAERFFMKYFPENKTRFDIPDSLELFDKKASA
ncbi:MAG: hypothetical protein K2G67_00005, partial [Muribaculaceae bacterium]|nr:hypothetical protein [Muribaculaceae bacterium]